MKNLFAITLILFIGLTACKKEAGPIPSNQTNPKLFPTNAKVMCLGDSRVEGGRPLYESYRYELWKNLKDKGRTFDFIGVQVDDTSYPTHNGESFDTDHFGFGGEKTKGLYKKIKKEIEGDLVPNIVFLCIGGNDMLEYKSVDKAIENINKTIDYLQLCNPNVVIFIEQIAPGKTEIMTDEFTTTINDFNNKVRNLATQQTSGNQYVISVDMHSNWSDNLMADDVHYNEQGAKEVADRYQAAMDSFFEN